MSKAIKLCGWLCAVFGMAATLNAAVYIFETQDWSGGGGLEGWTRTAELGGGPSTFTEGSGLGNPDDALRMQYVAGGAPYVDRISSGTAFLGDYDTYLGSNGAQTVTFDFYNYSASAPSGLQLYFIGSADPTVTWYYNIGVPLSAGWNDNIAVVVGSPTGWQDFGLSVSGFLADIQNITEIGFRITYRSLDSNEYLIDNVRRSNNNGGGFAVPEPGTYAALGFAFASMGLTFRRRLNDGVAKIKGMFKA